MLITREQLNKVLRESTEEYLEDLEGDIDNLLDGDIDLDPYQLDGLDIQIRPEGVDFEPRQLKYIEKIANLDEQDHMAHYEKLGLYHDGGDDFDYGGSFVSALVDLIKKAMES